MLAGCATGPGARDAAKAPSAPGYRALEAGRSDEARRAFEAQLERDPRDLDALYGLALVTHEAGDLDRAWALWLRLLAATAQPDARARDARLPHALAAIRRLETLTGDAPGALRDDFAGRLAQVDAAALPVEARQRLLQVRAALARRKGDESQALALDRQSGCPDRWLVAGPYGHLPRLDLERPFPVESGAREAAASELRPAPARGCEVLLDGPHARSGVLYAVGWVRAAEPTPAAVMIESDQPYRLYVDGQLAFSGDDRDRWPARDRSVAVALSAGWHRLALKVAGPGGRAEVELAVLPVEGHAAPLELSTTPPAQAPSTARVQAAERTVPPARGPAKELLDAEARLSVGDPDGASAALESLVEPSGGPGRGRAPKLAQALVLEAQAALEDPSRPQPFAQDRARRALDRALSLDPRLARARYQRAMLSLNADRAREALSRLADLPDGAPAYWRFAFARFSALKARGWMREAEEALAEARRLHPDGCQPLKAELELKRERHDVTGALALARQAVDCDGGSDELADLLRESGDLPAAIAEYRRLLRLDPARESVRAGLAESLTQAGELKEAAALFAELAAKNPRATTYRRQLADARVALGDLAGARRALEEGLAEAPESQDLHRAREALCEGPAPSATREPRACHILDPFRVDGAQVIAAYQKDRARPKYDSPAVIVLDRTVVRVFPTGARLTLTHNIIQVLAKDGIDKWGEVQIPENADVLTLRAVKADGSTREPEEIAGKQSISVPDLEPGDFVELEYVDPAAPPGAFPDGFLADRFYFRSFDAPLDRTELVLVTPKGMPVQVDARGEAPALSVEKAGPLELRTWAGRYKSQAFQEPSSTPFAEELPSVRVGSGISFAAWKDYLRDGEWAVLRQNAQLRARAAELTANARTPADKAAAIDAWVRKNVNGGGPLDEPATSILARGEGNRVTLEAALLAAAGLPSEIWLARSEAAPRLDGPLPDLEAYDQAVLHVVTAPPGGKAQAARSGLVLDPRYRHTPTGFLVPLLRGARALPLAAGEARLVSLPADNPDDRQMRLAAKLELDGSAEVTVREELRGWPALEWREALEKLPPDRVRPEFEQRTLGFYFPGSTLVDLSWRGAGSSDDAGPFVVEYKFRSPQLARRVGKRLVLPAPYPAMLGRRYVGVGARKTPLSLDYAAPTALDARFTLPPGVEVDLAPAARADGFGAFEQAAERTATGLELKARFAMPRTRVQPDRYRDFVDFATRVDRAEARAAEIAPR